jgi:hypothetical protein
MSPWTFQVGLNVTVDETWVDVTSRHRELVAIAEGKAAPGFEPATVDVPLYLQPPSSSSASQL